MSSISSAINLIEINDLEKVILSNDVCLKETGIDLTNGTLSSDTKIERTVISNLNSIYSTYIVNGDVLIENVSTSIINLNGMIGVLRIKNIKDSQIILSGICESSVYIENVVGGKFVIAGDQIRIHNSSNIDIYLFTKSSCILEDCNNLRFHPNEAAAKLSCECLSDSYWKSVHDFGFDSEVSFSLIE